MTSTPAELLSDLRHTGVDIDDLWELVNSSDRYDAAVPVLVDWLAHLNDRVPVEMRARIEEPLVRALIVPAARRIAPPVLIERFKLPETEPARRVRWAIGHALGVLAGDEYFSQLEELARNWTYGRDREALLRAFGRSKDSHAVPLLLDLLDDEDVVAHAIGPLGRQKDPRARRPLERLLTHERPLVRREAARALKRLPPE